MLNRLGDPNNLAKFGMWQFWFWIANLPPFIVAFFLMPTETFARFTLLYLGIATIVTAAIGGLGGWQTAKVEAHQAEDADVQEVLDAVEDLAEKGT